VNKIPGYIKGFQRRFYQNSIDHRGIPEKPGRVVTLVESSCDSKVYGIGYEISPSEVESVLKHLDYREKNGYKRFETFFHSLDDNEASCSKKTIVYVADESNPSWNQEHEMPSIARQILSAVGPSGTNTSYLFNLCDAMRENFPNHFHEDDHLFDLERHVNEMMKM
jgi:glutathione-specific gamma-glutamylcyclotransferase